MTMQEQEKIESFTVEEFRIYFDELIERVENGETFIIKSSYGNVIMTPYNEQINISQDFNLYDEELSFLCAEHEENI